MKKILMILVVLEAGFTLVFSQAVRISDPETLLPQPLLQDIINEASGDLAQQNEIILMAVNWSGSPPKRGELHPRA
jgi:hypothetical protein